VTEDDLQVAALERAAREKGGSLAELAELIANPPALPSLPVPLKQGRPVYDEATDGNRFAWILKAAKQVRIQEQAANEVRRIRLQAARRCAMPVLVAGGDAK
jgi:DNA-binding transcriptional MerR regulator